MNPTVVAILVAAIVPSLKIELVFISLRFLSLDDHIKGAMIECRQGF